MTKFVRSMTELWRNGLSNDTFAALAKSSPKKEAKSGTIALDFSRVGHLGSDGMIWACWCSTAVDAKANELV